MVSCYSGRTASSTTQEHNTHQFIDQSQHPELHGEAKRTGVVCKMLVGSILRCRASPARLSHRVVLSVSADLHWDYCTVLLIKSHGGRNEALDNQHF